VSADWHGALTSYMPCRNNCAEPVILALPVIHLSAWRCIDPTHHRQTRGAAARPESCVACTHVVCAVHWQRPSLSPAGPYPASLARSSIKYLALGTNALTGSPLLPPSLLTANLTDNQLSGGLPQLPASTLALDLSLNRFTGTVPASISTLQVGRRGAASLHACMPHMMQLGLAHDMLASGCWLAGCWLAGACTDGP
jgi:hypothetical protein